jgi:hypothetical protein
VPSGVRSACLALVLIGCTRVSDEERFEPSGEEIAIVQTVPERGAIDVVRTVQIDLCWSGLVDPRSVGDIDALIASGEEFVDTDLAVQLWPWRPPANAVGSGTAEPWCSGSVLSVTPAVELTAGVQYRLRLEDDIVGWAGEEIDTDSPGWIADPNVGDLFFLEFTVAENAPPPPGDDPPEHEPVLLSDLFATGGPFDPARGLCSCHTGADERAQALLDLSTPDAAFEDLVLPPRVRDTGFAMVTPRIPSESFLLHKLLRDPDGTAIHGVLGDPMPKGEAPLPYPDYVALARWIEDGALP